MGILSAVIAVGNDIVGDTHGGGTTVGHAVLGDVADAHLPNLTHAFTFDTFALQGDFTSCKAAQTGKNFA